MEAYTLFKCLVKHLEEQEYERFNVEIETILESHLAAVNSANSEKEVRHVLRNTVKAWREIEEKAKERGRKKRRVMA